MAVRDCTPDDATALATLFAAVGLFEQHELGELAELLASYFAGDLAWDHQWLAYDDGELVAAAYYALDTSPERMAAGTWNLYFIGVLPSRQGSGCGSALIRHVESTIEARGATDLLVETSGLASFGATRSFYRKHGYDAIARVADAYKAGDDKIIFRKRIAHDRA